MDIEDIILADINKLKNTDDTIELKGLINKLKYLLHIKSDQEIIMLIISGDINNLMACIKRGFYE